MFERLKNIATWTVLGIIAIAALAKGITWTLETRALAEEGAAFHRGVVQQQRAAQQQPRP